MTFSHVSPDGVVSTARVSRTGPDGALRGGLSFDGTRHPTAHPRHPAPARCHPAP